MNKHSKYRPLMHSIELGVMGGSITVYNLHQLMMEALDRCEEGEQALQKELDDLKASIDEMAFSILVAGHPSDQAGVYMAARAFQSIVRGEPDNAKGYKARAIHEMGNLPKIKADAVRDAVRTIASTNNGYEEFYSKMDLFKYANQLEGDTE